MREMGTLSDVGSTYGRPQSPSGQFLDIYGLPYVTNEVGLPTSKIVLPAWNAKPIQNDGYYNIKREYNNTKVNSNDKII